MKKLISFTLFLTIILLALVARNVSQAQVAMVKVSPVVITKSINTQRGYVWVDGYYRWNKQWNRTLWIDGYWAKPRYHHKTIRARIW